MSADLNVTSYSDGYYYFSCHEYETTTMEKLVTLARKRKALSFNLIVAKSK